MFCRGELQDIHSEIGKFPFTIGPGAFFAEVLTVELCKFDGGEADIFLEVEEDSKCQKAG